MPRPPKFLAKKASHDNQLKPLTKERWEFFLDDLTKGPGKGQAKEVIKFLLAKEKEFEGGWIPYDVVLDHITILFSISRQRLDQLMKEMLNYQIIKKTVKVVPSNNTPNQKRIFYQCCGSAVTPFFTPKGMIKDYPRLYHENIVLKNNLEFAKCLLEQHDLTEEYDAEMERRKAAKEQWKHMSRDEINAKIRNMTLEEYQEYKVKLESARKFYLKRDIEK